MYITPKGFEPPWKVIEMFLREVTVWVVGTYDSKFICTCVDKDSAEYIVNTVNSQMNEAYRKRAEEHFKTEIPPCP